MTQAGNVKGIGTDIVSVARIEKSWQRFGSRFAEQILHSNELQQLDKSRQPVAFLAKRFAVKEAVAKALGTGLAEGVNAASIEVCHQDNGAPFLRLYDGALARLQAIGASQCLISISDEKDYALAYAIAC